MNWLINLFKEIQLSPVLREKLSKVERERDEAKAEVESYRQRVNELELKVEQQRCQIELDAFDIDFSEGACNVLRYLFLCEGENCDIGCMADSFKITRGLAQYHLDLLASLELACCTGGNTIHEHVYWDLTVKGRRYVVEKGLLD